MFRPAVFALLLISRAAVAGDGSPPSVVAPGGFDLPPPPAELTTKRLDFKGGSPIIPVRLMEGFTEVTLVGRGRLRFRIAGTPEKFVEGPSGMEWKVRRAKGTPAAIVARIQVAEVPFNDKLGLAQAQQEWSERGLQLKSQIGAPSRTTRAWHCTSIRSR